MKKRISVLIAMLLTFAVLFTACSSGSSNNQGSSKPAESSAAPAQDVVKVKFGHNQATDTPMHKGAVAFKEKVEELSKGRIQVTIFPNMQLGQMREQAEQVQSGTLEITQQPASVLSNFAQGLEAYDIPFLFANMDAMKEVVMGPVGQEVLKSLEAKGFVGFGYQTGGLKNMSGKAPYHGPQDLAGKKIRVMPAPILVETYKALGANPTPIEFGELYNALQQGVVDGMENPLQTFYMMKYYEVQKAVTMTQNGPMLYVTVGNKKWFEGLPKDLQQNVLDAMKYGDEVEWKSIKEEEVMYLDTVKSKGMEVYYPTKEELNAFKEKAKPVNDFVAGRVGKDLVDKLLKAAEEANAKVAK